MSNETALLLLRLAVLAVMLFGLLGLIVPVLPGLVIIWAAGLVYGLVIGFTTGGWIVFAILSVLMIVGSLIDNFIMGAAAMKKGAPWWSTGLALLAGVIAAIFLTPFGGLAVALAVIFLIEFYRLRDWRRALDSTKSMAFGCGWSAVVRAAMGAVMIGLYAVWVFLL